MDRREFLWTAGLIVVAIPAGEILASCGSGPPRGGGKDGGTDGGTGQDGGVQALTFTSSLVHGHTHDVTIDVIDFDTPPSGGITKSTTTNLGHYHKVSLTTAQLKAVHAGQTVTQDTTVVLGHKHTFSFVQS